MMIIMINDDKKVTMMIIMINDDKKVASDVPPEYLFLSRVVF